MGQVCVKFRNMLKYISCCYRSKSNEVKSDEVKTDSKYTAVVKNIMTYFNISLDLHRRLDEFDIFSTMRPESDFFPAKENFVEDAKKAEESMIATSTDHKEESADVTHFKQREKKMLIHDMDSDNVVNTTKAAITPTPEYKFTNLDNLVNSMMQKKLVNYFNDTKDNRFVTLSGDQYKSVGSVLSKSFLNYMIDSTQNYKYGNTDCFNIFNLDRNKFESFKEAILTYTDEKGEKQKITLSLGYEIYDKILEIKFGRKLLEKLNEYKLEDHMSKIYNGIMNIDEGTDMSLSKLNKFLN